MREVPYIALREVTIRPAPLLKAYMKYGIVPSLLMRELPGQLAGRKSELCQACTLNIVAAPRREPWPHRPVIPCCKNQPRNADTKDLPTTHRPAKRMVWYMVNRVGIEPTPLS